MIYRFLYSIVALVLSMSISAADKFSEDFSSLSGTLSGDKNLPSGVWNFSGVTATTSNSVKCLKFSNGTVITPALDNVAKITFGHRAGGSNKNVEVSYSADGGSTWTTIETFTIKSSSSSFTSFSKKTGTDELTGVKFRIKASDNVYVNSFTATYSDGGVTPTDPDDPTYQTNGEWIPVKPIPAATGKTYYISPSGNDETGDGSEAKPWYNIAVAYAAAEAGDEIICKGGTYKISKYGTDGKLTVRMNKVGTADKPIIIRCEKEERPVFDFEQQLLDCNKQTSKVGDRGILLSGDYHIIYGIHMMHAADNAIKLEGSHNRIERCEFSYNLDTGIQLGFGHKFSDSGFGSKNDGTHCAYNDIIDCDSHHNCDCDANYGSDADGFACKMHNGRGNRFIRCRAWRNSDDAWDLYETDYAVKMIECWGWASGDPNDFGGRRGNGNGIKLGGNGTGGSSVGIHEAWYCVAFKNNQTSSVKGFDENSHKGGVLLVNCLAFDNGYDFMFEDCDDANEFQFYNNVCMGKTETKGLFTDSNNAMTADPKNAWKNCIVTSGFSKNDYVSLTEEDAMAPRAADGSLPTRFARLKGTSTLIGKAKDMTEKLKESFPDLWQNYVGRCGNDLGPYDYQSSVPTGTQLILTDSKELSLTVAHGNLQFTVPADGKATVGLYTPQGIQVAEVANLLVTAGGQYSFPVNAQLQKGIYIARLTCNGATRSVKFTVK